MKHFLIIISITLTTFSYSQISDKNNTKLSHIVSLYNSGDYKQIEINSPGPDSRKLILTKDVKLVSEENGMMRIEFNNGNIDWLDVSNAYRYQIRPKINVMIIYFGIANGR